MWRNISAVVLLSSLTAAQTASQTTAPAPDQIDRSTALPFYRTYTYYQRLPQGRTEKVAIRFHTAGPSVAHQARGEGIAPMRFEVTDTEALAASDVAYPAPEKRSVGSRPELLDAVGDSFAVQFNLKAAKDAPPGAHIVRGTLSYQQIGTDGALIRQQLDVAIPVAVAPASEPVAQDEWPFAMPIRTDHSRRDKITLWALAPLLIPLSIFMGIFCFVTGQDCSC